MPKCTICRAHVPTPKKVADWLATQIERIETDTATLPDGTNGVDYPGRSGGLRAIIEIAVNELRGVCYHHVNEDKS